MLMLVTLQTVHLSDPHLRYKYRFLPKNGYLLLDIEIHWLMMENLIYYGTDWISNLPLLTDFLQFVNANPLFKPIPWRKSKF